MEAHTWTEGNVGDAGIVLCCNCLRRLLGLAGIPYADLLVHVRRDELPAAWDVRLTSMPSVATPRTRPVR